MTVFITCLTLTERVPIVVMRVVVVVVVVVIIVVIFFRILGLQSPLLLQQRRVEHSNNLTGQSAQAPVAHQDVVTVAERLDELVPAAAAAALPLSKLHPVPQRRVPSGLLEPVHICSVRSRSKWMKSGGEEKAEKG